MINLDLEIQNFLILYTRIGAIIWKHKYFSMLFSLCHAYPDLEIMKIKFQTFCELYPERNFLSTILVAGGQVHLQMADLTRMGWDSSE